MTNAIYLEGGGDSKELHARCREGFRKLFERCGFRGRMPRLIACGGRSATFDDFVTAHHKKVSSDFIAMLVDSEAPAAVPLLPWKHLKVRDGWERPTGAKDDQALLMVTCMETWIVADRATLDGHYGSKLQKSALPALTDLERLEPHVVQQKLAIASRNCSNAYQKGKRSFELLAKLAPGALRKHLLNFERVYQILEEEL